MFFGVVGWENEVNNHNYHNYHKKNEYLFGRMVERRIRQLALSSLFSIKSNHLAEHYASSLALENNEQQLLLTGGSDGRVLLYNLAPLNNDWRDKKVKIVPSKTQTSLLLLKGSISTVEWYPNDPGIFIASSFGGTVNVCDAKSFSVVDTFSFQQPVYRSKFNKEGNVVAAGLLNGQVVLCDMISGDSTHTLMGHASAVTAMDWCPDNSFLLATASKDGSVRVWDIRKGGRDAALLGLDWLQDHTALATTTTTSSNSSNNNNKQRQGVKAQNLTSFRKMDWNQVETSKAHDSMVFSIKFTKCGRYLLTSGGDSSVAFRKKGIGKIRLWNTHDGSLLPINYPVGCCSNFPYDMVLIDSPSSSQQQQQAREDVFVTPMGTTQLALCRIHQEAAEPLLLLDGHVDQVKSMVFREQYQQLVSSAKDGLLLVWHCPRDRTVNETELNNNNHHHNNHSIRQTQQQQQQHLPPQQQQQQQQHGLTAAETGFLPPIIRNYLEDMNRRNAFLQQQQQQQETTIETTTQTSANNSNSNQERKRKKTRVES